LVIKRLRRVGVSLPFDRINQVDSAQKFYYVQEALERAALECGIPRVWFDDNWGDRWTEACEVHGNALRRGSAPVVYGMPALAPGYMEAQEVEFPHSNKVVYGGCIIEEGKSPAREEVLYCQMCRNAERTWESSRGNGGGEVE
jgi:hypothetical protein